MLEVLQGDPLPAGPHLRAVNHAAPGQVGQEGHWVTEYDFGHRVRTDALVLADSSIHHEEGLIEILGEEKDTESWK